MTPVIRLERHEDLTRLTLNRPHKGNSLSAQMVSELSAALASCHDDRTRVLLVDAEGDNFCTGFDLSNLDEETDDTLLARFVRVELLLQRLHRAPFLTVAVAKGKTWGAGADLFAACGQRWVLDGVSFSFPGAAFGLVLGTSRLASLVGPSCAEEWVGTGVQVDAGCAHGAGLANCRMKEGDTLGAALALAGRTRRLTGETLSAIRGAAGSRGPADDAMDLARLVESAARPGLRQQILDYRNVTR